VPARIGGVIARRAKRDEAIQESRVSPWWIIRGQANGSAPFFVLNSRQAGLAQLVEHVICNHGVGGSNPSAGTRKNDKYQVINLDAVRTD
jgi:hypothetical protein